MLTPPPWNPCTLLKLRPSEVLLVFLTFAIMITAFVAFQGLGSRRIPSLAELAPRSFRRRLGAWRLYRRPPWYEQRAAVVALAAALALATALALALVAVAVAWRTVALTALALALAAVAPMALTMALALALALAASAVAPSAAVGSTHDQRTRIDYPWVSL